MINDFQQKIELIGVDVLDRHRSLVEELKSLAASLGIALGWHYLLDLSWIISQLNMIPAMRVVDAGAGIGLMQWYLAGKGAEVISVDRANRVNLPLKFQAKSQVRGLRIQDLCSKRETITYNLSQAPSLLRKGSGLLRDGFWAVASDLTSKSSGRVVVYHQDLRNLAEIPDASIEAVIAVSSLEHNPPDELEEVVNELMRVIKPGGVMLATLGASPAKDWFHQPSQGWCYTAETLRLKFNLPPTVHSNYDKYDQLFDRLVTCQELRDHLAEFYFLSGDNGMPWGKWDPQYQPVGVCKVKQII